MLTYDMTQRGNVPLYDYLSRCIREDILQGVLKPGEKLPSRRSLARHLSLSAITVENAYAQLTAEGLLYTRERSGYFVSPIQLPPPPQKKEPQLEGVCQEKEWFLDLGENRSNPAHFPFTVWSRLMRRVLSEGDSGLLGPLHPQGEPALREAIARHLYRFRGMTVSPQQIIVGAGTEYLYQLVVHLLGRESVIAIENPGHRKIRRVYQANGMTCIPVSLDEQGMSVQALEQTDAVAAHLSPSHHYPTGIVTTAARRYQLLHWAEQGKYLIEDDYDSEFRFGRRLLPTLQSADTQGRVIYMNTFSKTLAPSIRIGYMVLPPSLLEQFHQRLGFYSCPVSIFEQMTLALFLREGYFEKHLNRMGNFYNDCRAKAVDAVRQSSLKGQILEEHAGLHFLVKLHTDLSDAEIKQRAAEAGVLVRCLSDYSETLADTATILINYSGIDLDRLPEALSRICEKIFGRG